MRKIATWILASNRNKILTFAYIIVGILLSNLIASSIKIAKDIDIKKATAAKIDTIIEVKGQSIYINGEEVYKFLPVPGGTICIKDSLGRRDITVRSFMLGEIPVSTRLQEYIYHNNLVYDNSAEFYFDFPANNGTIANWLSFIELLNQKTGHKFRLPTNDEWEYAARGGALSLNYKYAGGNNINNVAYYKENCKGLGSFMCKNKQPNELGFYDMSGCIWEVTSTKIQDYYEKYKKYSRMFTGKGNKGISDIAEGNIARGGSYDSSAEECELNYIPAKYIIRTGARLVMDY